MLNPAAVSPEDGPFRDLDEDVVGRLTAFLSMRCSLRWFLSCRGMWGKRHTLRVLELDEAFGPTPLSQQDLETFLHSVEHCRMFYLHFRGADSPPGRVKLFADFLARNAGVVEQCALFFVPATFFDLCLQSPSVVPPVSSGSEHHFPSPFCSLRKLSICTGSVRHLMSSLENLAKKEGNHPHPLSSPLFPSLEEFELFTGNDVGRDKSYAPKAGLRLDLISQTDGDKDMELREPVILTDGGVQVPLTGGVFSPADKLKLPLTPLQREEVRRLEAAAEVRVGEATAAFLRMHRGTVRVVTDRSDCLRVANGPDEYLDVEIFRLLQPLSWNLKAEEMATFRNLTILEVGTAAFEKSLLCSLPYPEKLRLICLRSVTDWREVGRCCSVAAVPEFERLRFSVETIDLCHEPVDGNVNQNGVLLHHSGGTWQDVSSIVEYGMHAAMLELFFARLSREKGRGPRLIRWTQHSLLRIPDRKAALQQGVLPLWGMTEEERGQLASWAESVCATHTEDEAGVYLAPTQTVASVVSRLVERSRTPIGQERLGWGALDVSPFDFVEQIEIELVGAISESKASPFLPIALPLSFQVKSIGTLSFSCENCLKAEIERGGVALPPFLVTPRAPHIDLMTVDDNSETTGEILLGCVFGSCGGVGHSYAAARCVSGFLSESSKSAVSQNGAFPSPSPGWSAFPVAVEGLEGRGKGGEGGSLESPQIPSHIQCRRLAEAVGAVEVRDSRWLPAGWQQTPLGTGPLKLRIQESGL
mmetsp:Transcript_25591/g.50059  ORF Transcript_25591/g.50059 Transcript_25591/m.50059 type:complete len:757 (+) Transcript_25591:95-2365(+)